MGEAKRRGSFHERQHSAKTKKLNQPVKDFITSENFKISYSEENGFVQVAIIYLGLGSNQQIILRADNRDELALSMIQFGFAYMSVSNNLFSLIAPDFHQTHYD